jgi:hypothetical protein
VRNAEAAWVIREYIRTNSPCNGLLTALQMAVTALEQQPEPQTKEPVQVPFLEDLNAVQGIGSYSLTCDVCHTITTDKKALTCPRCGAHELKPVYKSDIGQYVRLEGGQEPAICGTDGSDITPLPDSQCIANARLIAAAPEMLEALHAAETIYAEYFALKPDAKTQSFDLVIGAMKKIRDAQRKAEEGQ